MTVSLSGREDRKLRFGANRKRLAGCLLAVALTMGGSSMAVAQSSEIRSLVDRINRLEQDITDVQRQVYSGAPPVSRPAKPSSASPSSPSSTSSEGISSDGLALLLKRIDALEEDQRRQTGVQEETTFKLNQISTRLDKLVKDVDFRLTEIETRFGGQGSTGMVPLADTQNQATTGTPETSGPAVLGEPAMPDGSKVLGTMTTPKGSTPPASTTGGGTGQPAGSLAPATGAALPDGSASDQYNYAISLVRADRYDEAEVAFKEFLSIHKDDPLAGNAQYWLGETYYVRGNFPDAASAFFEGYQNYPDSSKAADNLLKLGMTLGRMDQKKEACATFAQMDKQFNKIPLRLSRTADREKKNFGCTG